MATSVWSGEKKNLTGRNLDRVKLSSNHFRLEIQRLLISIFTCMGRKQTGKWFLCRPLLSKEGIRGKRNLQAMQNRKKEGPTQAGILASQSHLSKGAVHFVAEMSLCVFWHLIPVSGCTRPHSTLVPALTLERKGSGCSHHQVHSGVTVMRNTVKTNCWDMAPWHSACQACVRPWVPSQEARMEGRRLMAGGKGPFAGSNFLAFSH